MITLLLEIELKTHALFSLIQVHYHVHQITMEWELDLSRLLLFNVVEQKMSYETVV